MPASAPPAWVLTFTCVDKVGIVAAVSRFLADRGGFISDRQKSADRETGGLFVGVAFGPA